MTHDDLIARICARNERLIRRADTVAGALLAAVIGVAGAFALAYYLTPCDALHLCGITGALLDRRKREREIAHMSLPELLLSTGVMTGPHSRPKSLTVSPWARVRRALRAWAIRRARRLDAGI